MNTKFVPDTVVMDEPIVIDGAVGLGEIAEIVAAVASESVSAVVPMSTVMFGNSQLRFSALNPYRVLDSDAAGVSDTVVDAPPDAHDATMPSLLVTAWR